MPSRRIYVFESEVAEIKYDSSQYHVWVRCIGDDLTADGGWGNFQVSAFHQRAVHNCNLKKVLSTKIDIGESRVIQMSP